MGTVLGESYLKCIISIMVVGRCDAQAGRTD